MGVGFGRLLEEFGIKNNIKQDFCTFTGNMVKAVLDDLDQKYQKMRVKLTEKLERAVLDKVDEIELFSSEFAKIEKLI